MGTMPKLPTIRRLASSILKCGQNKIWLDPHATGKLSSATNREEVRDLIKENFIIRRKNQIHSMYNVRKLRLEKSFGRHTGPGKVKGAKGARIPAKDMWIKKIRALRCELKQLRKDGNIDSSLYKTLYRQAKGNLFKNVKQLNEHINQQRIKEKRLVELEEQAEALKMK